ncbi:hypothetical protein ILUMI_10400 [Ignelater luminosus]|uniref:DDE Tnp4 domain-containing protein n=1 Tax=Ignelater luminosus TaxID=2038154 RepID=A0A8K0D2B9_IGNLU|nr:hypothetical protein ILUMI_10400 [Ignelater luminosus]
MAGLLKGLIVEKLAEAESIMSDTSSSDEDIEELLNFAMEKEERPKVENFVNIVINEYSAAELKRNFRIHKRTFIAMNSHFRMTNHFPKTEKKGGPKSTFSESRILAFLWYARNKCCMRDVAGRFGMAESTFHGCFNRVLEYLISIAPVTIKFPEIYQARLNISRKFEQIRGFPGVIGCIDGTYILIKTPIHKIKSTYVNRHDMPSVTLQRHL